MADLSNLILFLQNVNVNNRDGNGSIPDSDGHRTSTPVPAPDSELPVIPYESESSREVGSPAAPSNGFIFSFRVLVPGNGTTISGPHYEDGVTSFANRSTSQAQVPSNIFHQSSIPSPPSTAPPSYRNNETASPSRSLTSDANGSPSPRSTPPPSYQEVMEGAYSEQPPTYWQTVLHPRQHNSDSE